ncbi:type IV pilus modification PilV family protein [Paracidovorax sp. MALMAid1276]|uniref:type IV pilus modification PilV family protein n=1 Tax=Paracidovorax sp. MALMAid1276 TaxID=3411631 RepID=UPI003B9D9A57
MIWRSPSPWRAQQGLSLLELLVAFSIMALSLGLLYRSMGSSARNVADMAYQQQAAMVAESLLASRESVASDGWNETGDIHGYRFEVRSTPYQAGFMQNAAPPAPGAGERVPLHQVAIVVSWLDGSRRQALEVQTLLPQRKPDPMAQNR